jgi:hypothetical protein
LADYACFDSNLGAHVFNRPPEGGSDVDQPIHKGPMLESALKRLAFPHDSVNIKYLEHFVSKFVNEAKKS